MVHQKSILITGGTDGIGLSLANLHIALGDLVYIVGKRKFSDTPLAQYQSSHMQYIQHDLTEIATIDTIWSFIQKSCKTLNYVYLNAAIGFCGEIHSHSLPHIRRMIEIGVMANIALLNGLLPLLSSHSTVRIIGSLAAFYRHHSIAVYSSIKAALATLVDNINTERSYPCRVSYVVIGAVHTNFHKKSGMTAGQIKKINGANTTAVAHTIYTAKNTERIVIGFKTNLLFGCLKILGWWQVLTASIPQETPLKSHVSAHSIKHDSEKACKRALIVGAAEGIGFEICNILLQAEYSLVVVDYQEKMLRLKLNELVHPAHNIKHQYRLLFCDLTDQKSISKLLNELIDTQSFDVVYLPAAISAVAPFHSITIDTYRKLMQCNATAHLQILCHLLQHNNINPHGAIVLFSSLAHIIPYPGAAAYAATKTLCTVFAQSLYEYLKNERNISMYAAILGPVNTEHASRYSPDNSRKHLRYQPMQVAQILTEVTTHSNRRSSILFISRKDKCAALCGILLPRLMKRIIKKAIFDKITTPLLPKKIAS